MFGSWVTTGWGVPLAAFSILFYDVGYVLEKQALVSLPPLGAPSLLLVRTLLSTRRWVAGFVAMLVGLAVQVIALTVAPVSVVEPILAGGTVLLIPVARLVLRERLGSADQVAIVLLVGGVMAVAVSTPPAGHLAGGAHPLALVALIAGVVAAGTALAWKSTGYRRASAPKTVLAVGLYYGTGAVAKKGVAIELVRHGFVRGSEAALLTVYPWLFLLATAVGMALFQVGLQRFPAAILVPASNGTSAGFALVGAAVIFGEPWAGAGWHVAVLLVGYAGIVAGLTVLTFAAAPVASVCPLIEPAAQRQTGL